MTLLGLAVGLLACVVAPGSMHTAPTRDTADIIEGEVCPDDVARLRTRTCVETTGPTGTDDGPAQGTGTVAEVGGVLAAVPGATAFAAFEPCRAQHEQQVRLIDSAGETWTFGWGIDGGFDEGSADGFAIGEALDFYVALAWQGYVSVGAIVLSDADGPRFLTERFSALTDEQRGGVGLEFLPHATCIEPAIPSDKDDWGPYEHDLVRLSTVEGTVELRSGQSATIATTSGSTNWTVTGAYWALDCTDGCGASEWMAWETP